MTVPASAQPLSTQRIGARLPSAREQAAANQLRRVIAAKSEAGQDTTLTILENGKQAEIVLTPDLSRLLLDMLRSIGSGDAVTLVPVTQMLTTQQAADILNVSRPFLIQLLEREDIPYDLVGRHRRIRAEDLFAYKEARDRQRAEALSGLAELDADLI
ncbi:helix-turn-helix domain-containing protein [Acidisoma sp. C75]